MQVDSGAGMHHSPALKIEPVHQKQAGRVAVVAKAVAKLADGIEAAPGHNLEMESICPGAKATGRALFTPCTISKWRAWIGSASS